MPAGGTAAEGKVLGEYREMLTRGGMQGINEVLDDYAATTGQRTHGPTVAYVCASKRWPDALPSPLFTYPTHKESITSSDSGYPLSLALYPLSLALSVPSAHLMTLCLDDAMLGSDTPPPRLSLYPLVSLHSQRETSPEPCTLPSRMPLAMYVRSIWSTGLAGRTPDRAYVHSRQLADRLVCT